MAAPRMFDHDEARARRAAGDPVAAIAADYGVTKKAVYQATSSAEQTARRVAAQREWRWRGGSCEACGGPAMRLVSGKGVNNRDGRCLCRRCRDTERRERLAFDDDGNLIAIRCSMVDCANGERWQPPSRFSRGARFRDVRPGGIHGLCRACQTRQQRGYRARRRAAA